MPSFYLYLKFFESFFQSRFEIVGIKTGIKVAAQMSESEFCCTYSAVLLHTVSKFSSALNVPSSFKTLPVSDTNVLFLWFESESNRIPCSPKSAIMNIYILLEWIRHKNNFSTPHTHSFFLFLFFFLLPSQFSRWAQVAPEIIL